MAQLTRSSMLLCIVKPYLIHYLINDSYNKLNNVEIDLIQENIVSKVFLYYFTFAMS